MQKCKKPVFSARRAAYCLDTSAVDKTVDSGEAKKGRFWVKLCLFASVARYATCLTASMRCTVSDTGA